MKKNMFCILFHLLSVIDLELFYAHKLCFTDFIQLFFAFEFMHKYSSAGSCARDWCVMAHLAKRRSIGMEIQIPEI